MSDYDAEYRTAFNATIIDIAKGDSNGRPYDSGQLWDCAELCSEFGSDYDPRSKERGMWDGRRDAYDSASREMDSLEEAPTN